MDRARSILHRQHPKAASEADAGRLVRDVRRDAHIRRVRRDARGRLHHGPDDVAERVEAAGDGVVELGCGGRGDECHRVMCMNVRGLCTKVGDCTRNGGAWKRTCILEFPSLVDRVLDRCRTGLDIVSFSA